MYLLVFFLFFLISVLTLLREVRFCTFLFRKFPFVTQFVPTWSFFAPIPSMYDHQLVYRGVLEKDLPQPWKAIYTAPERRSPLSFLWNPEKRLAKSLFDLSQEILLFGTYAKEEKEVCTSLAYLQLLHFVDESLSPEKAVKIQFAILTNSNLHDYSLVFISQKHPHSKTRDSILQT